MTFDDVDKMEAGAEMDISVARKVLGWKEDGRGGWYTQPGHVKRLPKFSKIIAAAWEVVSRVFAESGGFDLGVDEGGARADAPQFGPLVPGVGMGNVGRMIRPSHTAFAETAPLAICRAALKASLAAKNG